MRVVGHCEHCIGSPVLDGLYAANTPANGWRILEWSDGAWWHPAKVARWCALDPKQWVGPLPAEFLATNNAQVSDKEREYDL